MVAEKQIDEFVSRMKTAAGQNLQSVILYGSAATGEYQTEFSNLNLLCILRESSFASLSAIAPVVDWWHRQKHPAPLVMTQEELSVPPTCSQSSCSICSITTVCSLAMNF